MVEKRTENLGPPGSGVEQLVSSHLSFEPYYFQYQTFFEINGGLQLIDTAKSLLEYEW